MNGITIIGISGKRGVGKDLLGNYLTYHGFKKAPFAEELKNRVRKDFNLSKEHTDGNLKEKETKYVKENGFWSPRDIMIEYGQFFRKFDKMYWVNRTFDKIKGNSYGSKVCITDVRFKSEAEYVLENGGYLIRLNRNPKLNVYQGIIDDASEIELDNYDKFDIIIPENKNENPQDLEKVAYELTQYISKNPRKGK